MSHFQTSNGPFSELREPILTIRGAKWRASNVLLEKQNEKSFDQHLQSVFFLVIPLIQIGGHDFPRAPRAPQSIITEL